MSAASMQIDPSRLDVISSEHYEANGYPFREWAWLRRHDPVRWIEHPDYEPFWAITKHADIIWLSTQPRLFLNGPRLAVFNKNVPPPPESTIRHLLNMDPPDHGRYRNVSSKQFTPRAVRALEEKVERITREVLDEAAARDGGDFVRDISAPITIAVIAEMLGVPASDRALLFRWTNEVIAPEDPEYQREGSSEKTIEGARIELFQYFDAMSRDRRAQPREDIVSVVANGEVEGKPLDPVELLSYYLLLVVAGNETTRNAMTGGLLTFLEHPGEWRKLRQNAALLEPAVEEVVRWITPVIQFCRTATRDARAARQDDPRGPERLSLLRVGQPRRGGVRGSGRLPHRPHPEPPHRLRRRRARLPRRPPRAPRAAHGVRAAARAPRCTPSSPAPSSAPARASSAASSERRCGGRSGRRGRARAHPPARTLSSSSGASLRLSIFPLSVKGSSPSR